MSIRPKPARSAGVGWSGHLLALAIALAIFEGRLPQASAATVNWTDGTSNWSTAANWTTPPSTHNVPGAGDTVNIVETDGVSRTITYDYTGTAVTLGSLTIDLTGGSGSATTTLSMAANNLTAGSENIGQSGSGTLNQSGGTNTDNGGFGIGSTASANGTYNLSGTGVFVANGGAAVGFSGTGTFNQSGGSATVAVGNLNIGYNSGSNGTYNLSGGSTTITNGSVFVGGNPSAAGGKGNLIVSGSGILTTSSTTNITLYNTTGSGLTLSGGTINTGYLNIPSGNTALFNWTAGTLNWNSTGVGVFIDSANANLASTLNLGAGQALTVASSETIAFFGTGTVNQSGGTNTINGGALYISPDYTNSGTSTGSYLLSGGTLALTGGGSLYVGGGNTYSGSATATFSVSGSGIATISGTLKIWNMFGARTIVNLTGGTLSAGVVDVSGDTALLNWTGGTLNLSATNLVFDSTIAGATNSPLNANTTLNNSQVLQVSGGTETIGGGGSASLTLNSATNTVSGNITIQYNGTLTLNGTSAISAGAGTGTLTNNGALNWNGGTLTGQLVNQGTISFGPGVNATASNGVQNNAGMTLASNQTLNVNGAGLNNLGTFTLTGGTIAGNGPILNNGTIAGYGTIGTFSSPGFTNNALVTQSGGALTFGSGSVSTNNGTINLNAAVQISAFFTNNGTITLNAASITGAFLTNAAGGTITGSGSIAPILNNNGTIAVTAGTLTISAFNNNNGNIELAGVTATLAGNPINNYGTIEGFGKISSVIENVATIEATGGTLVFTTNVTGAAASTIRTAAGTKVLMQGGSFPTNAGLIDLAGGTFDNGGSALNNTGSIVGYGVLSTGGLTNNANVTFTGGTATINGNVTNSSGKTINIKYQPAIFTGNITNNGNIIVTGTTVTYTGTYTGNAYISDPSTNIFQNNVTIISGGSMTGGSGDQFIFSGGTFTNNGTFSNGGLLQSSDPSTNTGAFTQSGLQSWSNGSAFTNSAGTATFASDAGSPSASPLSLIITGGAVHLATPQHLNALTLNAATLDLDLTTPGRPTPNVQIAANSGLTLNGGNLTFTNHATGAASLGYYKIIQYSGAIGGAGVASLTLPAVQNNVAYFLTTTRDPGFIDVHRGFLGDANDDGVVNGIDLGILAGNFFNSNMSWAQGDFNGDGVVNGIDLGILAGNFFGTVGAFDAASASGSPASGVPEPASLLLLGAGLAGVLGTRRRVRRNCASKESQCPGA